jgi:hypothetical protein
MDTPGTPARQNAVLAAFRTTASVSRACKAAEVSRRQHYTWLEEDPHYAAQFETAKEEAAQQLEDEAVRRAYQGFLEPLVFQGNLTYPALRDEAGAIRRDKEGIPLLSDKPVCIRRHSDSLLMFLLKGWRPKKYRDRIEHEVTGTLDIVGRLREGRKRVAKVRG